jgi:hypothetical protein
MLGVGKVRVTNSSTNNIAEFQVRDRALLLKHIIPLFDHNRLLTSKEFNFELFKQALLVATDNSLSTFDKHALLTKLKQTERPVEFMSSA